MITIKQIEAARKSQRYTQAHLTEAIGVAPITYAKALSDNRPLKFNVMVKAICFLNLHDEAIVYLIKDANAKGNLE